MGGGVAIAMKSSYRACVAVVRPEQAGSPCAQPWTRLAERITDVIEIAGVLSTRMNGCGDRADRKEPTDHKEYPRGAGCGDGAADARGKQGQHSRAAAGSGAEGVRAQRFSRRLGRGDRIRGGILDRGAVLELRRQGGPVSGGDGAGD